MPEQRLRWVDNNQALTWELLHQVQKPGNEHIRIALWTQQGDPPAQISRGKACMELAALIFSEDPDHKDDYEFNPSLHARSTECKYRRLLSVYAEMKKTLRKNNMVLPNEKDIVDDSPAGIMWGTIKERCPQYFVLRELSGEDPPEESATPGIDLDPEIDPDHEIDPGPETSPDPEVYSDPEISSKADAGAENNLDSSSSPEPEDYLTSPTTRAPLLQSSTSIKSITINNAQEVLDNSEGVSSGGNISDEDAGSTNDEDEDAGSNNDGDEDTNKENIYNISLVSEISQNPPDIYSPLPQGTEITSNQQISSSVSTEPSPSPIRYSRKRPSSAISQDVDDNMDVLFSSIVNGIRCLRDSRHRLNLERMHREEDRRDLELQERIRQNREATKLEALEKARRHELSMLDGQIKLAMCFNNGV